MKKARLQKAFVAIALAAMLVALVACGQGSGTSSAPPVSQAGSQSTASSTGGGETGTGRIEYDPNSPTGGLELPFYDTPETFTLMTGGGDSWNGAEAYLATVEEKLGIRLEVTSVPWGAMRERYQTLAATGKLMDLMHGFHDTQVNLNKLVLAGLLEPIDPHLDQMPNLRNFIEENPGVVDLTSASDGQMYVFSGNGFYAPEGITASLLYSPYWIDSMDVTPKLDTWEDVTETARALKAAKPDAYPFLVRSGINVIVQYVSPQFGASNEMFYDEAGDTWKYGPIQSGFKDLITMLAGWYEEGLLHPEAPTMDSQQYFAIIQNEQGTYQGGAFLFEAPSWNGSGFAVLETPDGPVGQYEVMLPPAGTADGRQQVRSGYSYTTTGLYGHTISASSDKIDAILKFLDYSYSEEGKMLLSWGVEGEHYTMTTVDGVETPLSIQYEDKPYDAADVYNTYVNNTMFGWQFGFYGLNTIKPSYNLGFPFIKQDVVDGMNTLVEADAVWRPDPPVWFDDLESTYVLAKIEDLKTYMQENVAQFIIGDRPLSELDAFIKEMEDKGATQLEEFYNTAWARRA